MRKRPASNDPRLMFGRLMPPIDATASVRRLENERGDRLRRTPVVFRVARLVWQSPVLLSVASALFSIVAFAALC